MPAESGKEEEGVDVAEHLEDAIAGNLRLKRLLTRDSEDATTELSRFEREQKRRRLQQEGAEGAEYQPIDVGGLTEEQGIELLLAKWRLTNCKVTRYVLENASMVELTALTSFHPDLNHPKQSPAEMVHNFVLTHRDRAMCSGGSLDVVSSFRWRWKLQIAVEQKLRILCHKDLRYLMANYDGSKPLEEVIEEAKQAEPPEDSVTAATAMDAPGPLTLGRFVRLELIDPLADALIVGDANLTFALRLAKHRKALGHVGRVVATTFEPLDCLRERYKEIDTTIKDLEEHYAEVWHEVDCTRIAVDPRFQGHEDSFGAVYYNFPHAGAVYGFFDGHPLVRWRHENLMHLFFRALRTYVKEGGSVKVASNMKAVGVRYADIISSAIENEFLHVETVPFKDWSLHRYGRSYGDRRDSYKRLSDGEVYNTQRIESDMVYSFCYAPTGKTLPKQWIRVPPSYQVIANCYEGPLKTLTGEKRQTAVDELFQRFSKELSGEHVG